MRQTVPIGSVRDPMDRARRARRRRMSIFQALAVIAAILLASCGATSEGAHERYRTVHQALSVVGLSPLGSLNEGSLPENGEAHFELDLRAGQCDTFVVFGSSGVEDIDLQIFDDEVEVGRDATHDRQAAAQVCPTSSGPHRVIVRMVRGRGSYLLAAWTGRQESKAATGSAAVASAGGEGTCDSPLAVRFGEPVSGDTTGAASLLRGSCVRGSSSRIDGPERVYRLEVTQRSMVHATLHASFGAMLYVTSACGESESELACVASTAARGETELQVEVEPGVYHLVVDGHGRQAGSFRLEVEAAPSIAVASVCASAPPILPGRPVSGTTEGAPSAFDSTCATGAHGPDRVFKLEVGQPSRIRVRQTSGYDGVLHVRSVCTDVASEIGCNDDFPDVSGSMVSAQVPAGTYYVVADGYTDADPPAGAFTLLAEVAPAAGGGTDADSCSAAGEIATEMSVDTFEATDEYVGSCGGQDAADTVYRLRIGERSRVVFRTARSEQHGVLYIRGRCDDASSEVICTGFEAGGGRPRSFETNLAKGDYYVFVDGREAGAFGAVQLAVKVQPLAATERSCRAAPFLRPGKVGYGNLDGRANDSRGSCAPEADGADQTFRLRVQRRSRVKITMESDYPAVLHLRRDCVDPSTEVACSGGARRFFRGRHAGAGSGIDEVLDPGTYFVIAGASLERHSGPFMIRTEMMPL